MKDALLDVEWAYTIWGQLDLGEYVRETDSPLETRCDFCGYFERVEPDADEPWEETHTWAVLLPFEINDLRTPLETVGAHLHRRAERLQDLTWRRFEELLASMFREHGFQVVLGRGTKDRGIDLILLEANTGTRTLVQAKRWRGNVGVGAVRELRGVQLRENVRKAILAATSGFTYSARAEADAAIPRLLGFKLDLMAATDIARELGVFRSHETSLVDVDRLRAAYHRDGRRVLVR